MLTKEQKEVREELIENGFSIRIIGEAEFLALIKDT